MVVSTVLLSVVADGVVDAVVSDDGLAGVDDAEAGDEPWDVLRWVRMKNFELSCSMTGLIRSAARSPKPR